MSSIDQLLEIEIENERGLLSRLLRDPECLGGSPPPRLEAFLIEDHRKMYQAIINLQSQSKEVDPSTVAAELHAEHCSIEISWFYAANQMATGCYYASGKTFASRVNSAGLKRLLKTAVTRSLVETANHEFEDQKNFLLSSIEAIGTETVRGLKSMKHINQAVAQQVEDILCGKCQPLLSGIDDIDEQFKGFMGGELVVIAGRPGMGKTGFAMNLAKNMSKTKKVIFYSFEMSDIQLGTRFQAMVGGCDMGFIRNPAKFSFSEIKRQRELLALAQALTDDMNLLVCEDPNFTLPQIKSECRRIARREEIGAIFVDQLELIGDVGKPAERYDLLLQEKTRALKKLAQELNCPVFLLAQLNRKVDERPNRRPLMSDLKNSGAIEQDADTVILLYREEYYAKEEGRAPKFPGICEVIAGKQRMGEACTVPVFYDGATQRFSGGARMEYDKVWRNQKETKRSPKKRDAGYAKRDLA